jgi:RNA polymerase sigma-70 factor, ECF subfamily
VSDLDPPAPLDSTDERRLVDRARTDPDAFAVLYRRYLPRIHAFAVRRSGSQDVADDIAAGTFERALSGLPGFRWERGGFSAWLYRIAANLLADHHRARGRAAGDRAQASVARFAPTIMDSPEDHLDRAMEIDLRSSLDRLSLRYQHALALRYLADLDHATAAAATGLSSAHFAVVLHRAKAALRRELERDAEVTW